MMRIYRHTTPLADDILGKTAKRTSLKTFSAGMGQPRKLLWMAAGAVRYNQRFYQPPARLTMSNMGNAMESTMNATIPPNTTMIAGSIMAVSLPTLDSTSPS